MGGKGANWSLDRAIAATARRHHGIVTLAELLAAGLSPRQIEHRAKAGRLHRVHRGVYAVGHPTLTQHGVWLAAVKACGPGAALSHQSAAQLARMLSLAAYRGPVHVTVPGTGGRKVRRRIVVHRSRTLTPAAVQLRDGIPTTTPARTLSDLKRTGLRDEWEDAFDRAHFLSLPIEEAARDDARSRLERAMRRLCRRHRLPAPELNVPIGPYRADFLCRDHRLIVETDGWEAHRDRASFESDRARDAELKLRGYEVVRFTYRQVLGEPDWVARTLRALLARQAAIAAIDSP